MAGVSGRRGRSSRQINVGARPNGSHVVIGDAVGRIVVPEDLTGLDEGGLNDLLGKIEADGAEMAKSDDMSDDAIAEIEGLADDMDRVLVELDGRRQQAAEQSSRRSTAIARLTGTAEEGDEGEQPPPEQPEPEGEPEGAELQPVLATGRPPVRTRPRVPAPRSANQLNELAGRRPAQAALREGTDERPVMRSTAFAHGVQAGSRLDVAGVAKAIADTRMRFGVVPEGTRDYLSIASGAKEGFTHSVSADAQQNFETLRDAIDSNMSSLVASGSCCTPLSPLYDFFRLAEAQSPIEDAIPSVSADRGGVRFIKPPDYRTARSAIGFTCCPPPASTVTNKAITSNVATLTTSDANDLTTGEQVQVTGVGAPFDGVWVVASVPTGTTFTYNVTAANVTAVASPGTITPMQVTDKPCVRLTCPTVMEQTVCAVSQCITFDNLSYRTFPEQVQAFLEDVAVAFQTRKEIEYLNAIANVSTATTFTTPYGAARTLLAGAIQAASAYRKRNGMRRNAPLTYALPDWSIDVMKVDLFSDGYEGLEVGLNVPDSQVIAMFGQYGLTPVFYNDTATSAAGQDWTPAQGAGALNAFPTTVVQYLHAPGTFVRLDGGTLDVGLVRDSQLNRKNDVEMFMEEWTGLAMLGLESVKLTTTVCPSGTGPLNVAARTCP
jgi:hypothetical protein